MFSKLSPFQRTLFSSIVAFVGYGGWGFTVNQMHGFSAGIKAGLVQGSYSFVVTLIMTLLIEMLFKRALRLSHDRTFLLALTVIPVCCLLYISSWGVNVAAGTPEIFHTVLLGYILGTIYTLAYTLGLLQTQ